MNLHILRVPAILTVLLPRLGAGDDGNQGVSDGAHVSWLHKHTIVAVSKGG